MASEASTPQSSSSSKPDRTPGTTIIPVSRVKRVVKEDKDISIINAEATFCITYATVSVKQQQRLNTRMLMD